MWINEIYVIMDKRRGIQLEGYNAWVTNNKIGFVQLATGLGKSWLMLDALSDEKSTAKCIILAETHKRDHQYHVELKKYSKTTGKTVSVEPILDTYQKMYRAKSTHYDLVVCDECDYIGLKYFKFFENNTYDRLLLLSATRSAGVKYITDDGKEITKGGLLDSIAPLVYSHTAKEGLLDGTSRQLDIVVFKHNLDGLNDECTFPYSIKKTTTGLSEVKAYKLFDNRFEFVKNAPWTKWKNKSVMKWANARAQLLYGLPSKRKLVKKLMLNLGGQTLIFGNNLDSLYELTQNTISSRNSDGLNMQLINDMTDGKISHIAANKLLTRGSNLGKLDNIILMSYQSSLDLLLQRIGRLRVSGDLTGKVYMFITEGTQEEVWFDKILPTLSIYNLEYQNSKEI